MDERLAKPRQIFWFGNPKLRNPQKVADAKKWCENQKLKGTIETLKSNLDDGGDGE